jgi:uncharacterized membrane protein YphA (DoxX/SURF4 family)
MTKTLIPAVVRVLLGALFLVFGANKLVPFMPMPELPAAAAPFVGGLASTGYFFPLLGSIEVVMGALLIAGRFVPLALTVLAPIVVQIALFHLVLVPSPGLVGFILGAELYLAWTYRAAFTSVLQAQARPATTLVSARVTLPRAA